MSGSSARSKRSETTRNEVRSVNTRTVSMTETEKDATIHTESEKYPLPQPQQQPAIRHLRWHGVDHHLLPLSDIIQQQEIQQLHEDFRLTPTGGDHAQLISPLQTSPASSKSFDILKVWHYSLCLGCVLGLWVLYLILPKGFRKHYFNAYPRRYARSSSIKQESDKEVLERWIFASQGNDDMSFTEESREDEDSALAYSTVTSDHRRVHVAKQQTKNRFDPSLDGRKKGEEEETSTTGLTIAISASTQSMGGGSVRTKQSGSGSSRVGASGSNPGSSMLSSGGTNSSRTSFGVGSSMMSSGGTIASHTTKTTMTSVTTGRGRAGASHYSNYTTSSGLSLDANSRNTPSPRHPAIEQIPAANILAETMRRLKARGIRLMAFGVECQPKRVWIKLDDHRHHPEQNGGASITWQTEFPRRVADQFGEVSIVLMRGSLHRVTVSSVLYIDVGKKTSALTKDERSMIPAGLCFSLLTHNGSLDLQANSELERDALVCCLSMVLDQIHERDWRTLYEESSSYATGTTRSGTIGSGFGSATTTTTATASAVGSRFASDDIGDLSLSGRGGGLGSFGKMDIITEGGTDVFIDDTYEI